MTRFFAVLIALAITFGQSPAEAAPEGWAEFKSPHSFEELVGKLQAAIEANKMFVVTKASASVGAKRRGVEIPGNMVFGVYRNDFAVRMLEASIPAGIEAPIRFYVTENDDKTAKLSYRTPTSVFAPYEDGGQVLKDLAAELDDIYAKIAADAVAE